MIPGMQMIYQSMVHPKADMYSPAINSISSKFLLFVDFFFFGGGGGDRLG